MRRRGERRGRRASEQGFSFCLGSDDFSLSLSPRSSLFLSLELQNKAREVALRQHRQERPRLAGSLVAKTALLLCSFLSQSLQSILSHLGELLPVALCICERPVLRRDQVKLRAFCDAQRRVGLSEAHLRGRGLSGRGRRVRGLGRRGGGRRSSAGRDIEATTLMVLSVSSWHSSGQRRRGSRGRRRAAASPREAARLQAGQARRCGQHGRCGGEL